MRIKEGDGPICMVAIAVTVFAAACGGGSGGGTAGAPSVAVSGIVATDASGTAAGSTGTGDTFRVRATSSRGSVHDTETDLATGHFTLMLPANDSYVMGFEHRDMMNGQMHSAGHMVFSCGAGQSDCFFLSGGQIAVDLGTITVHLDGSPAGPAANAPGRLDRNGNGIPDSCDPNTGCVDIGGNQNTPHACGMGGGEGCSGAGMMGTPR
jgi:hypothetical protein